MKRKIRTVLVGCGRMSQAWLEAAARIEDIEIAGLVDLRRKSAETRAAESGLAGVHIDTSFDSALEETRPDAVFDVTAPPAHKTVTLAALRHGCHVLGEKPMAESMEDAREMCAAARKAGKIYAVIQNRRYDRNIRTVRTALASGVIGQLHTVNADFYLGPHFGGFREEMKHVLLVDMAIHSFDQARFLSGADAVSVFCHEYNPPASWYRHGAAAMALFQMSDGIVFNYRGAWCAEGHPTSWQCQWRFVGSRGTLLWDGDGSITAETVDGKEGFFRPTKPAAVTPVDWSAERVGHEGLIRDFVSAVRTGKPPPTHCGDNIKSLAMVFGAVESAVRNSPVDITD
ncbi:MAG: Gfo/Idh/MocA family oxidoreductase [Opitutales bacterium]|nr:Gfo/Idh/MocA family oxidoreductase [Opitutales bacterium]